MSSNWLSLGHQTWVDKSEHSEERLKQQCVGWQWSPEENFKKWHYWHKRRSIKSWILLHTNPLLVKSLDKELKLILTLKCNFALEIWWMVLEAKTFFFFFPHVISASEKKLFWVRVVLVHCVGLTVRILWVKTSAEVVLAQNLNGWLRCPQHIVFLKSRFWLLKGFLFSVNDWNMSSGDFSHGDCVLFISFKEVLNMWWVATRIDL